MRSWLRCLIPLWLAMSSAARAESGPVVIWAPQDSAAAAAFQELTDAGQAVPGPPASFAARLIYLETPHPDWQDLVQEMPSDGLLVLNSCGWPEGDDDPGSALRADLARPQSAQDCDADALRTTAVEALAAPTRSAQISRLSTGGYRLRAAPGPLASDLVITALPQDQIIRLRAQTPVSASANTRLEVITGGSDRSVQSRRAGLPEPSIIVGDLASLLAPGLRGPMGIPLAEREKIRARDPELFARLLVGGGFDPDPDQLPAAIQSELSRMKCYSGTIDGLWGNGSRAALTRFVTASTQTAALSDPDTTTFRALVNDSQTECPPPRVVTTSPPATTRRATGSRSSAGTASRSTTRQRSTSQSTPRQQPAAQPTAPSAPTSRQINPNMLGSGVFR